MHQWQERRAAPRYLPTLPFIVFERTRTYRDELSCQEIPCGNNIVFDIKPFAVNVISIDVTVGVAVKDDEEKPMKIRKIVGDETVKSDEEDCGSDGENADEKFQDIVRSKEKEYKDLCQGAMKSILMDFKITPAEAEKENAKAKEAARKRKSRKVCGIPSFAHYIMCVFGFPLPKLIATPLFTCRAKQLRTKSTNAPTFLVCSDWRTAMNRVVQMGSTQRGQGN